MSEARQRVTELKEKYHLQEHVEGGSFSEVYTAPFENNGRSFAGSIYFLLDAGEISHFHQIDCDEIWFFHEGCGLRITLLSEKGAQRLLLGNNLQNGERAMVLIPGGSVFAAENLEDDGYTFISCVTVPAFSYAGFRLVSKSEIRDMYGEKANPIAYLAFDTIPD